MKLFTAEDIRNIERHTLQTEAITTLTLIERVGKAAAAEISSRFRPTRRTIVFAGPGNNGADALLTAYHLQQQGFSPLVYLFNIGGTALKPDCKKCRDMIRSKSPELEMVQITKTFDIPDLGPADLVIDGLFGTGLSAPLDGGFMALVRYINESGATVVSLDMPSGMFAEWNRQTLLRNMVHAHLTLAIQYPRVAFFISDNAEAVGVWKTLDIGLSKEAADAVKTDFHLVGEAEIKPFLKSRKPFTSKADYGSALLVAGRYGMVGASIMSARGALRSGVGKLTVYGPQCAFPIVQAGVPEALFECDDDKLRITHVRLDHNYTAVGIGPGIGTAEVTIGAVEALFNQTQYPIVADADALNCIAKRHSLLERVPERSVLTPHPAEFDRMFGEHTSEESRIIDAIRVCRDYNIIILLKGHYTKLIRPDGKVYINTAGTPALATAGSGDVLTGIILSFMAQGMKPEVAALVASYIHGRAGEMAAAEYGEYGVTATDIAKYVGNVINQIINSKV